MGASPLRRRRFPDLYRLLQRVREERSRATHFSQWWSSRQLRGAPVSKAGVRAPNRDRSSLAVVRKPAQAIVPAPQPGLLICSTSFAGGERGELLRAKHDLRQERGSEPRRGADLRQRRDPQGSGGVVPKLRVAAETGLESILFSQVPRRVIREEWESMILGNPSGAEAQIDSSRLERP